MLFKNSELQLACQGGLQASNGLQISRMGCMLQMEPPNRQFFSVILVAIARFSPYPKYGVLFIRPVPPPPSSFAPPPAFLFFHTLDISHTLEIGCTRYLTHKISHTSDITHTRHLTRLDNSHTISVTCGYSLGRDQKSNSLQVFFPIS